MATDKNKGVKLATATFQDKDSADQSSNAELAWASDAMAEMLRRLDLRYIALTPGASYRGLHDSMVNYLGNRDPQMLVCLHEEHAVAIAQGYAQVTERPMAVALHSNVGLMHATMAIFNAWCGRAPIFMLGATGPGDAEERRPWIDWIHTSKDQGALIRHYTKWDDEPRSVGATLEAHDARASDRLDRAARPDLRLPRRRAAGIETRRAGDLPGYRPPQARPPAGAVRRGCRRRRAHCWSMRRSP